MVQKKIVKKTPTKKISKPVKKTVVKKPVSHKRKPAKKQHIIKRILNFKIKGWISRKSLFIGLGVMVLVAGSFAGYSIWQGMTADAGGVCTLGRSGKNRGVPYATSADTAKYNTCKANAASQARLQAEADARAKAAALAQAQAAAAAKASQARLQAEADARAKAAAAVKAAADKAAAAKAATIGWTRLDNQPNMNDQNPDINKILYVDGVVDVCKKDTGKQMYQLKAMITITNSTYPSSFTVNTIVQDTYGGPAVAQGNAVPATKGNASVTGLTSSTYPESAKVPSVFFGGNGASFARENSLESISNIKFCS